MKISKIGSFAGALVMCAAPLFADPLPTGDAEALGFDTDRLAKLDATLNGLIDKGTFPGAVVMIARDGQLAHLSAMGKRSPEGAEMTQDSIFRIYSMTKPITTAAAMTLVEEGKLDLSYPLAAYLPEFANMTVATGEMDSDGKMITTTANRPITIQDLMRHTSGITYGFFGAGPVREAYNAAQVTNMDLDNTAHAALIASLPLEHQPGTTWEYSRSTDILGAVIEKVTGQPLIDALHARIFDPLGMEDTGFYVTDPAKQDRIAEPFAGDDKIGPLPLFDPRVEKAQQSGGGGLTSTIHDYSRFAQMMLNGGALDGVRILSPKTVQLMTSDHMGGITPGKYYLPGNGYGFGLGYGVRVSAGNSTLPGTVGDYYWGGAAGTYYYADPAEDMFVLLMIQSPNNRVPVRSVLKNVVAAAMADSHID